MPSQKIPLFGGMIVPIHNGNSADAPPLVAIPTIVASPPDKALLPQGIQGTYEVHLWIRPGGGLNLEEYSIYAYLDNDPATRILVYSQKQATTGSDLYGPPIKILDGYPVRGNISLELVVDIPIGPPPAYTAPDFYPVGVQAFGYYFRVGQGLLIQPERRFIGEESPDGITSGIPIALAAEERRVIHVFETDRLDEISLAFTQDSKEVSAGQIDIRFEDSNGNLIIPGQQILMALGGVTIPSQAIPNFLRDPQSVYSIYQVPFGGGFIPNLHQIAVTNLKDDREAFVHGYFTRR